jgi:hypothetical protein
MDLNWRQGEGKEGGRNYCEGGPTDQESRPTAVVRHDGFSDEGPWVWFIGGFPPVTPDARHEELSGRAARKQAAEETYPNPDEIRDTKNEAGEAWKARHDAQQKAVPNKIPREPAKGQKGKGGNDVEI